MVTERISKMNQPATVCAFGSSLSFLAADDVHRQSVHVPASKRFPHSSTAGASNVTLIRSTLARRGACLRAFGKCPVSGMPSSSQACAFQMAGKMQDSERPRAVFREDKEAKGPPNQGNSQHQDDENDNWTKGSTYFTMEVPEFLLVRYGAAVSIRTLTICMLHLYHYKPKQHFHRPQASVVRSQGVVL